MYVLYALAGDAEQEPAAEKTSEKTPEKTPEEQE